jgi:hypothetical protein
MEMDKQSILIMLGANLDKYGVPEDEIMKNVKMFERYLNSLTPEEYKIEVENIDVDAISENIYKLIQKRLAKTEQTAKVLTESSEDTFAGMDIENTNPQINAEEITPPANNKLPVKSAKLSTIAYEQIKKDSEPIDFDSLDEIPIDELPQTKGTPAFWAIFFLTLPITIPILLAVCAVFFAVLAAMACLIVGLIASLIGIVAAGSALSLIGIVYGVTQTFTALPIGLYEIGLGIFIGGTAMLSGILIYNFAVRFLPFAIKNVIRFSKFVIKRIKYLFYFLKKESAAR